MDGKFLGKPVAGVPRSTPSTTFRGSRTKKKKKKKQRRNRRGATSDFSSGVIAIEPARQRFSIFISILRLIRIYGETRDVDRLAPRMPGW